MNECKPLLTGIHVVQMSPLTFISKPAVWLAAVSKYRGGVVQVDSFKTHVEGAHGFSA